MKYKLKPLLWTITLCALFSFSSSVTGLTSEHGALASDWPCCAATTERMAIKRDQKARLELKNTGEESLAVRLRFVDKEGKVLIQRDTSISPGDVGALEYGSFGGGVRSSEFQAQFGTESKTSIGLLRPALRIVDNASGNTVRLLGPESFSITFQGQHKGDRE